MSRISNNYLNNIYLGPPASLAKSNLQLPLHQKRITKGLTSAVPKSTIGVFCSLSCDSNSAHSVYFPAEDPPLELPQASEPQELPTSIMSSEHVSTLEQALSNSEARYLKTQKQIQSLADGLQQIQQPLLQQQPIALPNPSPKNSDNTLQNLICQAPPLALPNKFDGDCSKGQAFLCSCQTYILPCLESFSNNQMKIVWALPYMKLGRAGKWAAHIFKWEEENEGYTKFLDWDDFKSKFCKEFYPANSNSTTINKLESTTY